MEWCKISSSGNRSRTCNEFRPSLIDQEFLQRLYEEGVNDGRVGQTISSYEWLVKELNHERIEMVALCQSYEKSIADIELLFQEIQSLEANPRVQRMLKEAKQNHDVLIEEYSLCAKKARHYYSLEHHSASRHLASIGRLELLPGEFGNLHSRTKNLMLQIDEIGNTMERVYNSNIKILQQQLDNLTKNKTQEDREEDDFRETMMQVNANRSNIKILQQQLDNLTKRYNTGHEHREDALLYRMIRDNVVLGYTFFGYNHSWLDSIYRINQENPSHEFSYVGISPKGLGIDVRNSAEPGN